MGAPGSKKAPPLPQFTDTDTVSNADTVTELASPTEVSRLTSQTLPEDGSPVTIATRKTRHKDREGLSRTSHQSQTSLLIEYFEGGKGSEAESRKPSVRVKVTPSSKSRRSKDDHIQITETKGSRKPSYTKRINLSSGDSKEDKVRVEGGDNNSLSSYPSATEESNVSRNPIEIEVMSRRPHSPLIPSDSKSDLLLGSNVSSMPANSFLDGKSGSPERQRSRSLTRGEIAATGALAGLAAGAIADKLKTPARRRSRSLSRERVATEKATEKSRGDKSERRRKSSGSRSRSMSNTDSVTSPPPRRRSSRNHEEISTISAADNSQISGSRLSVDQRSYRSATSKASSINNPKLLETVEDAIRRLILPELTALKKEQRAHREKFDRDRRGSITSGSTGLSRESREDIRRTSGSRSTGADVTSRSRVLVDGKEMIGDHGKLRKERRGDHLRDSTSPRNSEREVSEETITRDNDNRIKRTNDKKTGLGALAAGLGLGALTAHALQNQSRENLSSRDSLDERQRRKRRTKSRSRSDSRTESYDSHFEVQPPMPLMSDINPSDVTRSSILSVDTERPSSASHERLMTKDVRRGIASPSSRTPTRTPRSLTPNEITPTQRVAQSDEFSHSSGTGDNRDHVQHGEMELDEHGRKIPMHGSSHDQVEEEEYGDDHEESRNAHPNLRTAAAFGAGALLAGAAVHHYANKDHDHELEDKEEEEDLYQQQGVVPPPLKYVPYNQEKRGLSPIQSVSGYTEDEIGQGVNHQSRESKLAHSTGSYSNERSPRQREPAVSEFSDGSPLRNHHDFADVRQGGLTESELTQDPDGQYWDEQHLENDRNRHLDAQSYRSSDPNMDYNYADDNYDGSYQTDRVAAGQNVRGIGGKPDYVHTPDPVESAVASLLDASVLTGHSGSNRSGLERQDSYASYDEGSERHFTSRGNSPNKRDKRDTFGSPEEYESVARDLHSPDKYAEYEVDDHGRKIAMSDYNNSHTSARPLAAAAAAAAVATAMTNRRQQSPVREHYQKRLEDTGAPLQKSFKDRARGLQPLSPRHSVDRFSEGGDEHVKMSASGVPDANDPMPEIGRYRDDISEADSRRSFVNSPLGGEQAKNLDYWPNQPTPKHPAKLDTSDAVIKERNSGSRIHEAGLDLIAAGAVGAAAVVAHSRESSRDHDDQWQRTSDERKRDTINTNPFEGTSPITLLGGQQDRNLLEQMGYDGVNHEYEGGKHGFNTGSPGPLKDEGYISSAPNALSPRPSGRTKGVGFMDDVGMGEAGDNLAGEDPFYTPKHSRHLSGLSHGMSSPLYDSATGAGMDRIQSKDIVALMDHLTVRDAHRSARDTEILVTLVRSAAEMRNSFEDMRRLLADTEDVIIEETRRNTDKSVQKAINGPRPPPPSINAKSIRGSQDEMIDDIPNKRRNVFRRALKGLSMRSSNDLAKIEDMLVQLLGDVEGLKVAQGLQSRSPEGGQYQADQYDDINQEGAYEQDRGYEPEGNSGSTTVSHASQSGHFSNPLSRGASAQRGEYGRKYSENRISTVPEGDEEELDDHEQVVLANQFENNEKLLTPVRETVRGSSAPLGTPPKNFVEPASFSNENTPTTGKSRKATWNPIPKISRWSETTASSVAKNFRGSGRRDTQEFNEPASRSGSDVGHFDQAGHEHFASDKLHTGFSNDNLNSPGAQDYIRDANGQSQLTSLLPPEDPKYKAHRNSLNLQHPQPRPGPTHRHQTALESQAQNFDTPNSPRSMEWNGSSNSVNRLPPNSNAPQNRYSSETGPMSPASDNYSHHSANGLAPARPPKEPLAPEIPAKIHNRLTKPSPLSKEHLSESLQSGNGDGFLGIGSPRSERRVLSANLSGPTRKPTGPRSMGSPRGSAGDGSGGETRRKRDTFGTINSAHSLESETF